MKKSNLISLLTLLLGFINIQEVIGAEPYAVLSDNNTVLTFYYDDQKEARGGMDVGPFWGVDACEWYNESGNDITTVVFDSSFSNCSTITSTAYWFSNCGRLTTIEGLNNLNTANVTTMAHMFDFCRSLTTLDLSNFNTENVKDMGYMFYYCYGLTSLNVSSFVTSKVTNMNYMFHYCPVLTNLDISSFNTSNVTDMSYMFGYSSGLTSLNLSNFNTANVRNMSNMFYNCYGLTSLDLSSFNTSLVVDVTAMFGHCTALKTIYVSNEWNTASVSTLGTLVFQDCTSLVGGAGTTYSEDHTDYTYARIDGGPNSDTPGYFTAANATAVVEPYAVLSDDNVVTFYYDDQKTTRGGVDINNRDYGFPSYSTATTAIIDESFANYSPTSTASWFYNCSSLTAIRGLEYLNTTNVTDMSRMFYGCYGLTSLDVSNFNTANVTSMEYMFYWCYGLTSLDVSNFNTENMTNMVGMFSSCSGLTSLNVSSFNTANVTDMGVMFDGCSGLTSLDVSSFNTANVTDMRGMFSGCSGLTSLDLSNFNTANVTSMSGMFMTCSNLTSLDLSNFNTTNVTDMSRMFDAASGLTSLDLSNFNTTNVTGMGRMFRGSSGLKTIYAGNEWSTAAVTSGTDVFTGCTSLVGGAGTAYSREHSDYTYAHIDGGEDNPGYFTAANADSDEEPTFDYNGVLTVNGQTTMQEALQTVGNVQDVVENISALVWNSSVELTEGDLENFSNPNMLIYVKGASRLDENRQNVIINGTARSVELTDSIFVNGSTVNGNFYCPEEFVAEKITFTHLYNQQTEIGVSRGWETLTLPFNVQSILNKKNGSIIAPFGNDASDKHFWLRQVGENGLTRATQIEANMPYLISMPNNPSYGDAFNQNGTVIFSAGSTVVPKTEFYAKELVIADTLRVMVFPVFLRQTATEYVYALNVGAPTGNYPEGSVFVSNLRAVNPFEVYTFHESNNHPAPMFLPLLDMEGGTTGIEELRTNSVRQDDKWYDLRGRRLPAMPTEKGIYIFNGKKIVK